MPALENQLSTMRVGETRSVPITVTVRYASNAFSQDATLGNGAEGDACGEPAPREVPAYIHATLLEVEGLTGSALENEKHTHGCSCGSHKLKSQLGLDHHHEHHHEHQHGCC